MFRDQRTWKTFYIVYTYLRIPLFAELFSNVEFFVVVSRFRWMKWIRWIWTKRSDKGIEHQQLPRISVQDLCQHRSGLSTAYGCAIFSRSSHVYECLKNGRMYTATDRYALRIRVELIEQNGGVVTCSIYNGCCISCNSLANNWNRFDWMELGNEMKIGLYCTCFGSDKMRNERRWRIQFNFLFTKIISFHFLGMEFYCFNKLQLVCCLWMIIFNNVSIWNGTELLEV